VLRRHSRAARKLAGARGRASLVFLSRANARKVWESEEGNKARDPVEQLLVVVVVDEQRGCGNHRNREQEEEEEEEEEENKNNKISCSERRKHFLSTRFLLLFGKVFFDFNSFSSLFFMYILRFCASGARISRLSASVNPLRLVALCCSLESWNSRDEEEEQGKKKVVSTEFFSFSSGCYVSAGG